MNAKFIVVGLICTAIGAGVIVSVGTVEGDVAQLQALTPEQQAHMLSQLRRACNGDLEIDEQQFCANSLCGFLPDDTTSFDDAISCFSGSGTFTLNDVFADFLRAEHGEPTQLDDCMDGVTGHSRHDESVPPPQSDFLPEGADESSPPEDPGPGAERRLDQDPQSEEKLPPTRLASLLMARRENDPNTSESEQERRLWGHGHNPHRHTNCAYKGHSFDCKCNTNTRQYSNAQVFNQCNKGSGNLSGEHWVNWQWWYGAYTNGHVNHKTWGIAVYSVDARGAFSHNVCGTQPWWTFGCGGGSNNCKCTCFKGGAIQDGGIGVTPSPAWRGAYLTKCLGMCGKDCKAKGSGHERARRYPSLVIHDACQAYIGSKESIWGGGLWNECGDEALHGTAAGMIGPCDNS